MLRLAVVASASERNMAPSRSRFSSSSARLAASPWRSRRSSATRHSSARRARASLASSRRVTASWNRSCCLMWLSSMSATSFSIAAAASFIAWMRAASSWSSAVGAGEVVAGAPGTTEGAACAGTAPGTTGGTTWSGAPELGGTSRGPPTLLCCSAALEGSGAPRCTSIVVRNIVLNSSNCFLMSSSWGVTTLLTHSSSLPSSAGT